jgi:hypothetical protein
MQTQQLSKLMYLSWEIQHKRQCTRARALLAAWVIYQNEDVTVYHLSKKHATGRSTGKLQTATLTLFS